MPVTSEDRGQQHDAGRLPGEISFSELGRDLRRYRWRLLLAFALFAGIGVAWAGSYWMFPRFVYTTTVELAVHDPDDRAAFGLRLALPDDPATRLQPPGALRERVEHIQFGVSVLSPRTAPVPVQPARAARRALVSSMREGQGDAGFPVDVRQPGGSELTVLLISRGTADDEARIRASHERHIEVLSRIQDASLEVLDAEIGQYTAILDAHADRQAEEHDRLRDRIAATQARMHALSAEAEALQLRVRARESALEQADSQSDTDDGARRAQLYDELRTYQYRLAGLDPLVHVSLPGELDRLHGRALELERERTETDLRRNDALGLRDTIVAMEVTGLAVAEPEHGARAPWIVLVSFLLLGLAAAVVVLLLARIGRGAHRPDPAGRDPG
jgi:hypothetical protein